MLVHVNSDSLIRIDSGGPGEPTPGANAGTITYNINGSIKHVMTSSSFGINTITDYNTWFVCVCVRVCVTARAFRVVVVLLLA